ncbi:UDP-glucose dehydrogenase family protein [Aestuariivirga sp.]|jgi:UDPglucose 6-dehydrogenase|uniref:UDP-glucose dehydrogenase family protein n=1 Tax=Aestuariivirga sp. TaxID=2650926 RepID=UPI0037848E9E
MKIAVIGAGYVGLVSAACFADFGHEVVCVDRDPRKLSLLEQGRIPIYELGLEPLVTANRQAGRLCFTDDLAQAVAAAEVVLLAVGTPTRATGDAADLAQLFSAAGEVARALRGFTVVVTKSTVPPGTAARLRATMAEARPVGDFEVASNPEFMREGSAVEDFTQPDRVVVGVASMRAENVLRQLYRPLTARNIPLLVTTCEAAEVIKYAANTFLATRIAFVNQLADFCERAGADVGDVTRGMGLDKRIGPAFLAPGPGFGGSCFPKDTRAMAHAAREVGQPFTIVESVIASNDTRKRQLVERVAAAVGGTLGGRRITVLGIAFKADTDDIRESSALTLIPDLQARGARLAVFDPVAMDNGRQLFEDVEWCEDAYAAATGADAVVVLTEWNLFRGLDLARLARVMRQPVLVDFRNLFLPEDALNAGLTYHSVGRPVVQAPDRPAAAVLPFRSGTV